MDKKMDSLRTRIDDLSAVDSEFRELDVEQLRLVEGGLRANWTKMLQINPPGPAYYGPMY
jgi:hypothetical protein